MKELRRLAAIVASILLVLTTVPTSGIAEELLASSSDSAEAIEEIQATDDTTTEVPAGEALASEPSVEEGLVEEPPADATPIEDAITEVAPVEETAQEQATLEYRLHREGDPDFASPEEGWTHYEQVVAQAADSGQDGAAETTMTVADSGRGEDAGAALAAASSVQGEDAAVAQAATEDAGMTAAEAAAVPLPIDALAFRLTGEATYGVEYHLRDAQGIWQETWTPAADEARAEGITGIAIRLTGELSGQSVWYRVQTDDGNWLGWAHDGEDAGSAQGRIVDVQALIVEPDEKAPTNEDAEPLPAFVESAEQEDQTSSTEDDAEAQENEDGKGAEATANEASPTDVALDKKSDEADKKDEAAKKDDAAKKDKASKENKTDDEPALLSAQAAAPSITYSAHVQQDGWQPFVKDGKLSGTTGKDLRVEAFKIKLKNCEGEVRYQAHVQNIGWQNIVTNGKVAGTSGKSYRVEALRISLSGSIAKTHDVWYRAYVQQFGWMGWVKNGASAGTSGQSLRMEGVQILLVKKGDAVPTNDGTAYKPTAKPKASIISQAHVQNIGWMGKVKDGAVVGTSGRSLRIEAIRINLSGVNGGVTYRTHIQRIGWQGWRSNGDVSGTSGKSLRLEAIQIKLTDEAAKQYDVYYRTHVQQLGWLGWAKNGASAGTGGFSYRMEALQIKLVKKGAAAPDNGNNTSLSFLGDTAVTYGTRPKNGSWQAWEDEGATAGSVGAGKRLSQIRAKTFLSGLGIRYSVCSSGGSWRAWKSGGAAAGVADKELTAVRFELTGTLASSYNVWYRVHVSKKGWLGWTNNGKPAGSDASVYAIEALEVYIMPRSNSAPGNTRQPYYYSRHLHGVDISGHDEPINISKLDADFVIIKATEGTAGTIYNPNYAKRAREVLNSGKLLGFYHYSNAKKANGSDAIAEADSFYNAVKEFKGKAILCLDWESYTYPSGYTDNTVFGTAAEVSWCKKFLDRLKSRFGGTPFIYTGKYETQSQNWSLVSNQYPLWGAQYASMDPVYGYQDNPWTSSYPWGTWGDPVIFQYTGNGRLSNNGGRGAGAAFDMDIFYGTRADWNRYLK